MSTIDQSERIAAVLVGQACGDALGVPYEFASVVPAEPQMIGGGLGPYAPGEWSDDTQMSICIARVSASGLDLTSEPALDEIARGFVDWMRSGATDIGNQTRSVLGSASAAGQVDARSVRSAAQALHASGRRTAGNGALMRTAIVGVSRLDDRDATARAARAVAELTHTDPLAGESCVIWSELIRVAVLTGELDPTSPLDLIDPDRRDQWRGWITEAITDPKPSRFAPNGFTVTALQAALAAVTLSKTADDAASRLRLGLSAAVRAGDDTDTVAAIAGGLLGALCGSAAIPQQWWKDVHGWPGLRADDLASLATRTASAGRS